MVNNHGTDAVEQGGILIPEKRFIPLTPNELSQECTKRPSIQSSRAEIQRLARLVYTDPEKFEQMLDEAQSDQHTFKYLSRLITKQPKSVTKLLGKKSLLRKNKERKNAERHASLLAFSLKQHAELLKNTKEQAIAEHRQRYEVSKTSCVESPNDSLGHLFSLPKKQQIDALSKSPHLAQELYNYKQALDNRLSTSERNAIMLGDYEKLSESLGVSIEQAKEVRTTFKLTMDAFNRFEKSKTRRSKKLNTYLAKNLKNTTSSEPHIDSIKFDADVEEKVDVLIPRTRSRPSTTDDMSQQSGKDYYIQANLKEIQHLAKIVYADPTKLDKIISVNQNNSRSLKSLSWSIHKKPQDISQLAGRKFFFIKDKTRRNAEKYVPILSMAVGRHARILDYIKENPSLLHQGKRRTNDMSQQPARDYYIQTNLRKIQRLAKIVYADPTGLNKIINVNGDDSCSLRSLSGFIQKNPQNISKLAGKKSFFTKNEIRRNAEKCVPILAEAVKHHAIILEHIKLLNQEKQRDAERVVHFPSKNLTTLFFCHKKNREKLYP
ncbi:BID domain-containing T4SS effector [Bartonella ancashensis]|uniref:Bartonella effector protein BID domain-containing protein n=1 Tax=Bartonella ancashensis TaxID=1318743 RepID=A0A0M3T2N1_9HYPH|nr:BID domain-containing T4SS effector [Bartonella ancashensis]ALE03025.1 hypothetical protein PU02_0211 [Bartonella ancashensis]